MLEITLAAQGAFKAFELLKKGVAAGKEIEDPELTIATRADTVTRVWPAISAHQGFASS